MKKQFVAILLSCVLLLCASLPMLTVDAAARDITAEEQLAAKLKTLGLFRGVSDTDFDLERAPTRLEALVMLIRVLGKEADALATDGKHPFTDVPAWAAPYVCYAYANGLTYGVSETLFGSDIATATTYLTFMLRALGYSDAEGGDFTWNDPYALAKAVGLLPARVQVDNFLRADVVTVSYAALFSSLKGSKLTLAGKLMAADAFSEKDFAEMPTPDAAGLNIAAGTAGVGIAAAKVDAKGCLIITLTDGREINAGVVKGADGERGSSGSRGSSGADGKDGKDGKDGADGKDGVGITAAAINAEGHLILTLSSGSTLDAGYVGSAAGTQGEKGDKGDKGDTGAQGIQGEKGDKGDKGDTGAQGIQGEKGDKGDKGDTGAQGIQGEKGDKGDTGAQGIQGEKGDKGDKGDTGAQGIQGEKGDKGDTGAQGVSITRVYVDADLHLWIEFSNGTKTDVGYIGVSVTPTPDPEPTTHTVTFKDWDGSVLKTETVEDGKDATPPADPVREGYTFTGWDKKFNNITADTVITATYTEILDPTIIVESCTAESGELVNMTVRIKNNPGILGALLTLSYNSKLTLTSVTSGEAFSSLTYTGPGKLANPCNFNWDAESGMVTDDGVILNLEFSVSPSAQPGENLNVSLSYKNGDIYDENLNDVNINIANGYIIIK